MILNDDEGLAFLDTLDCMYPTLVGIRDISMYVSTCKTNSYNNMVFRMHPYFLIDSR